MNAHQRDRACDRLVELGYMNSIDIFMHSDPTGEFDGEYKVRITLMDEEMPPDEQSYLRWFKDMESVSVVSSATGSIHRLRGLTAIVWR